MSEHDDEAGQTTRRGDLEPRRAEPTQPANGELSTGAGHKPANSELSAGADSGSEDLTVSRRDLKKGKPGRSQRAPGGEGSQDPEGHQDPKAPKPTKACAGGAADRRDRDAAAYEACSGGSHGAGRHRGTQPVQSPRECAGRAPQHVEPLGAVCVSCRRSPPACKDPSALTDTGARLDVTNSRLRPVVADRAVWRPIAADCAGSHRSAGPCCSWDRGVACRRHLGGPSSRWSRSVPGPFVLCLLLAIGRTKLAITTEVDRPGSRWATPPPGASRSPTSSVRSLLPHCSSSCPSGALRPASSLPLAEAMANPRGTLRRPHPTPPGVIEVGPPRRSTVIHSGWCAAPSRTDRTELFVHLLTTPPSRFCVTSKV